MKNKNEAPAKILTDDEILGAIGGVGMKMDDPVYMTMEELLSDCRRVAAAVISKIHGITPSGWFDTEYKDYSRVERIGWAPLYDLSHITNEESPELVDLRAEKVALHSELRIAQANDLHGMSYLSEIRQAMGHEGDFPSLVEAIRKMKNS